MILVTDANILITLFDVGGVSVLPRIGPTEVLGIVLEECDHDSQPGLRQAVVDAGISIIPTDIAWAAPAKAMMNGRLSFPDALSLYYAKTFGRTLVSGDKPLRTQCQTEGVEYRGIIWIVRESNDRGLLPPEELCRWVRTWPLRDRRLPREELEKLEVALGCR